MSSLGLTARSFHGFDNIQELECTGRNLDAEEIMAITMYSVSDDFVLASVQLLSRMCVTWTSYSSCTIIDASTKATKLKMLITDLKEDQDRSYGCNISSYRSGGRMHITSWVIVVKVQSKSTTILFVLFAGTFYYCLLRTYGTDLCRLRF